MQCLIGDTVGSTAILNDKTAICTVPDLLPGTYSVTFQTNGQYVLRSGVEFRYFEQIQLASLWPLNGPAFRGSTAVTVYGSGFTDSVDMACMFGTISVPALVLTSDVMRCRAPSHRPETVNVTITLEGTPLHAIEDTLQFAYVPDASVDKITPESGYTAGDYPVFVFGSNFINTSSLICGFADMRSRGVFLSPHSVLCLAPSPIGRSLLANGSVAVSISNNGYDFSDSSVYFTYSQPCDAGFFCPGNAKQQCPNGTYCPENSGNFTLCPPGFFQPRAGQRDCVVCPVGYICPDLGESEVENNKISYYHAVNDI
jgi:hypothetical protein